jgi:hypothetical protein
MTPLLGCDLICTASVHGHDVTLLLAPCVGLHTGHPAAARQCRGVEQHRRPVAQPQQAQGSVLCPRTVCQVGGGDRFIPCTLWEMGTTAGKSHSSIGTRQGMLWYAAFSLACTVQATVHNGPCTASTLFHDLYMISAGLCVDETCAAGMPCIATGTSETAGRCGRTMGRLLSSQASLPRRHTQSDRCVTV